MARATMGSLEWGERTHGILSRPEQMRLVAGLVRAQVTEKLSRLIARFGVHDRRIDRVDLDAVTIPDSAAANAAMDLVHRHHSDALRLHCLRTYYFAAVWSQFHGLRVDTEALYVASLLHDLGLADGFRDQSACCGFAVVGARSARQFAADQGWEERRRRLVYEAISYHLNPYLSLSRHDPEAACLQRGAHLDVIGTGAHLLPRGILDAVHDLCPRAGFRDEILETMSAMQHAPGSRASVLVNLGFLKMAAQNPLDRPA
ncbi:HD domain-containing protein [Aquisalimonas lutea]|uniref:HD domain-containing protein n=1 Tax=Aquisalimonas lutea TaxID=1327750 RepID=UPI0025B2E70B|nr:HD domain-containing protein [Aquisalimonas lutea]MDN3519127.1 HD domain-containing protein [Aquisalimonas lutea]